VIARIMAENDGGRPIIPFPGTFTVSRGADVIFPGTDGIARRRSFALRCAFAGSLLPVAATVAVAVRFPRYRGDAAPRPPCGAPVRTLACHLR